MQALASSVVNPEGGTSGSSTSVKGSTHFIRETRRDQCKSYRESSQSICIY